MPTYEYRCPNGHEFEHFAKMSEAQQTLPCPVCGQPATRHISGGAGLHFKGTGFYITDYGKDGKKDQRKAANESAASSESKSSESKSSESKSSESKSSESKSSESKSSESKPSTDSAPAKSVPAPAAATPAPSKKAGSGTSE